VALGDRDNVPIIHRVLQRLLQKSDGHGRSAAGLGPGLFAQERPYMFPNLAISIGTQASQCQALDATLRSRPLPCTGLNRPRQHSFTVLHSESMALGDRDNVPVIHRVLQRLLHTHAVTLSGQNDASHFSALFLKLRFESDGKYDRRGSSGSNSAIDNF
jgi:hypothetical protein